MYHCQSVWSSGFVARKGSGGDDYSQKRYTFIDSSRERGLKVTGAGAA